MARMKGSHGRYRIVDGEKDLLFPSIALPRHTRITY